MAGRRSVTRSGFAGARTSVPGPLNRVLSRDKTPIPCSILQSRRGVLLIHQKGKSAWGKLRQVHRALPPVEKMFPPICPRLHPVESALRPARARLERAGRGFPQADRRFEQVCRRLGIPHPAVRSAGSGACEAQAETVENRGKPAELKKRERFKQSTRTTRLRRSIHFDFNTTEWRGGLIASGILLHLVPLPLGGGPRTLRRTFPRGHRLPRRCARTRDFSGRGRRGIYSWRND